MPRIALFTDDPGWHGIRLREAFLAKGYSSDYVSLTTCRLALDSVPDPVRIPGFDNELPDGVFVRGVPGGSLEEVIFYLDILHALRLLGIAVYNDAGAIERSVDKAMTSLLLHRNGIPTPHTWVVRCPQQALEIARHELNNGHMLVSKPLFGSQGNGVQRYGAMQDLEQLAHSQGIYYLQRYIGSRDANFQDWRVFVIANKAVAAMRRCGVSWLNNIAQGARCEFADLDTPLRQLAEDAVRALNMQYAGVDIIRDEQGVYNVIEVNSVPAWKGLQSVAPVDIAAQLAEDFLARCPLPSYAQAAACL